MTKKKEKSVTVFGDKATNLRLDSWQNILTGINTSRDKSTYTQFVGGNRIDDETAESLYNKDGVAARLCDALPEHAMRKGFDVDIRPDEEEVDEDMKRASTEIMKMKSDAGEEIERLDVVNKVTEAMVWANVFGAGGLILGVDDGARGPALKEPLNEDNISAFTHLNIIDKRYMTPITWYDDPMSPKFGTPQTYLITPFAMSPAVNLKQLTDFMGIYEVHESRIMVFGGIRTTIRRRQTNNGWQESLLNRCEKTLRQFGVSWDMLANMIQDANQAVFKMEGLIDALAADEESLVKKRLEMLDMGRSAIRALVLDAGAESFERVSYNWGGIREPFDLLMYRLSVDARVPVAILMGRSPAGMNATGDSDWQNFESQVEAFQKFQLKEQIRRIVRLIFKNSSGPFGKEPENWDIKFDALRSMTPMEEADIKLKTAQTDAIYIDKGVLLDNEVALARFGPDSDSDVVIDIEARLNPEPEPEMVMPPQMPQVPQNMPPQARQMMKQPPEAPNTEEK